MEATKFNFEDLNVYQKSLEFVDSVYNVTNSFPKEEKFGLTSQFLRAATSISLNIAEGSGNSDAQFNRYLQMALDSVRECVVCPTIATRQKYVTEEQNDDFRKKLVELSKMISSLQKYLKNKTKA
ncbi:MAG: four helix bundle protein [Aequorivita sp.]|nr:four helix bundle protein [Aequorivita sp.]